MRKRLIIVFTVLFIIAISIRAKEDNYCQDEESWKEWEELVAKYPGDMDIQALHALRLGFCIKVKRGDITTLQATKIFESARNNIINKKSSEGIPKEKKL